MNKVTEAGTKIIFIASRDHCDHFRRITNEHKVFRKRPCTQITAQPGDAER